MEGSTASHLGYQIGIAACQVCPGCCARFLAPTVLTLRQSQLILFFHFLGSGFTAVFQFVTDQGGRDQSGNTDSDSAEKYPDFVHNASVAKNAGEAGHPASPAVTGYSFQFSLMASRTAIATGIQASGFMIPPVCLSSAGCAAVWDNWSGSTPENENSASVSSRTGKIQAV